MTTIAIDGLNEEEFRRSIEGRLRRGQVDEAVERLRTLLRPYAGPGRILPDRFLSVSAADLELTGWEQLGDRIRRHDRPGKLITALQIAFGWPGEDVPQPDAEGRLHPLIEIGYYNDDAFPFSASARDDLLDGYSYYGCSWADDSQASDDALSLAGIDDLHGALALLEARLLNADEPDEEEIRAGSLGACLLSVLLFQAVKDKIASHGLPRPLCVMAGSNGVYPYFDAPVIGMPEDVRVAAGGEAELGPEHAVPGPRYSSLLVTGIPRAQKRAVLVLEESEEEMGVRIARLRGLANGEGAGDDIPRENPAEVAITPVAGGPLLVKKQPHKGSDPSGWDFRDMLGPRDPALPEPSFDLGPGSSDDDWDDFEPLPPVTQTPAEPEPLPDAALFDRLREAFPPPPADEPTYAEQADEPSREPEPELEPECETAFDAEPEPQAAAFETPAPEPDYWLEAEVEAEAEAEAQVEAEPEPAIEFEAEPVAATSELESQPLEPPVAERSFSWVINQPEPITEAPDWWREELLDSERDAPEQQPPSLPIEPEPQAGFAPQATAIPTWANGLASRAQNRAPEVPRAEQPALPELEPAPVGRKRQVGVSAETPGLWQRLRAWFGG